MVFAGMITIQPHGGRKYKTLVFRTIEFLERDFTNTHASPPIHTVVIYLVPFEVRPWQNLFQPTNQKAN
jgi:hypothetical protein